MQYDFILAVALITIPAPPAPNDAEPGPEPATGQVQGAETLPASIPAPWIQSLRPALTHVAITLEILDPREASYTLTSEDRCVADLEMLQNRYRESLPAPYLEELWRFPAKDTIITFLAFNRNYKKDLCERFALDALHAEELRDTINETEQLHAAWDAMRDARCEYYFVTTRRQALATLRTLIGPEAFYRGQMPPPVPVWRFR